MESHVVLRKLTKKSVIDFGRHNGYKVNDLIRTGKTQYLIWMYFNCSNLSFVDELLDELNIKKEWRIVKPGTDKEMFKKRSEYYRSLLPQEELDKMSYKRNKKHVKASKSDLMALKAREKLLFSPKALKARNHGHDYGYRNL